MKISKLYLSEAKPIQYLEMCKERNSVLIKQVLKNNSYLLKKNKITQSLQIERLRAEGIRVSAPGIGRYKKGVFKSCALSYLQIFALYWKIELSEMISKDFESEQ